MCELLGLNFKLPVSPSFSFRGFRHRSEGNPHGWGIARYEGKACQILKEAIDAQESKLAEFVRDYDLFQSQIFMGHVRDASRGNHTLQNTHPFKRIFRSREVILAHNGTMESLPLDKEEMSYLPVGETDSEYIFCAILTALTAEKIQFTDYQKIERVLTEFNKLGKMNLLFSEGSNFTFTVIRMDITDFVSQNGYHHLGLNPLRTRIGRSIWQQKRVRAKGGL